MIGRFHRRPDPQTMKPRTILLLFLTCWSLAACGPDPTPAATDTPVLVLSTLAPFPSATASLAAQPTPLCPNPDCIYITPLPGTAVPLRFDLPTPGVEPVSAWRPPQYPVPMALGPYDHFYFARPIGANEVNWPIADYRYGGTFLTATVTHTEQPRPAAGVVYFDGTATQDRPSNVPTLAQVQDGEGHMVQSVWLLPGDPMIPYEARSRERHTARKVAGAIASAVGLGLAGWGASSFLAAQAGDHQVLDLAVVAAGGIGLGAGGTLLFLDTTGVAVAIRW